VSDPDRDGCEACAGQPSAFVCPSGHIGIGGDVRTPATRGGLSLHTGNLSGSSPLGGCTE